MLKVVEKTWNEFWAEYWPISHRYGIPRISVKIASIKLQKFIPRRKLI